MEKEKAAKAINLLTKKLMDLEKIEDPHLKGTQMLLELNEFITDIYNEGYTDGFEKGIDRLETNPKK